ncbi:MAG: hypothetical protein KIT79_15685 [Deltaproteobacteria bacterium]|nr:hypothetical protein [Deltaproteobacteria bacterium]
MSRLSKTAIENAFRELGAAALADGTRIRLLVVGGAAMALGFGSRDSTYDIDSVFLEPADASQVRRLATGVGSKLGLPDDWLNDAAKAYVRPPVQETVIFSAPGIEVAIPSVAQLAAMKLSAWRDDLDISDAETLVRRLKETGMGREAAWAAMLPYLEPGTELKAKYALDDLWETL